MKIEQEMIVTIEFMKNDLAKLISKHEEYITELSILEAAELAIHIANADRVLDKAKESFQPPSEEEIKEYARYVCTFGVGKIKESQESDIQNPKTTIN